MKIVAGSKRLAGMFVCGVSLVCAIPAWAGSYIFAGEQYGENLILHPSGYSGTGGDLEIGVCISTESANSAQLEIPVQNNIFVWNALAPIASNVQTNALASGLDVESVLLHEMGHCIGLGHVNAASESGFSDPEANATKATDGADNVLNINAGVDEVMGSRDDVRGDDGNLHWFNPFNDPFRLPVPTPIDTTTYSRNLADLPADHLFAENAGRDVAVLRGYPPSEAVMQQLSWYRETQRDLTGDGVATIKLAGSGLDETAGTSDDYRPVLVYRGIQGTNASPAAGCDITISMEGTSFAYCSVGGQGITGDHWRITSGSIYISPSYEWVYNTVQRGNQSPDAVDDSANVDEDGSINIDVLANDSDPDGDAISVSAVSDPPNGTASINANDTIAYSPDPNFNGIENFTYTVEDTFSATDVATVTVTVDPLNDLPVAVDDSADTKEEDAVDIDVLANDNEPDGEALTIVSTTQGSFGTVTNHDTYVTYQPSIGLTLPETDSFDYTISDGQPGSTDTATVTVNINPRLSPTADFTFDVSGSLVTFTDTSTDSYGLVEGWSWDFGDSGTSALQNPTHNYVTYGTFTVTLTVTDDDGETDDINKDVIVPPPCSASKSLPSGKWEFFSLPCMPADPRASTAFASGPITAEYNSRWLFYTYDSSIQGYVHLGPDDVLESGKGYLYFSLDDFASASVAGDFNTADPITLVTEPDSGAWNLIGNPFNGNVEWNTVNVSDGSTLYTWAEMNEKANNGQNTPYPCDVTPVALNACIVWRVMNKLESNVYEPYDGVDPDPGVLAPFDAIWVRSHRGVSMTMTESAAAAMMAAAPVFTDEKTKNNKGNNKGGKKDKNTTAEWYARLVVESGNYGDAGNWLGQTKGAKDGLDPRDLEELTPYSSPYLSIVFTNPLFDEVDWGYTRDIRELTNGQTGEWSFVVRSSSGISQATLSWQGESALFENAVLVDEISGETITVTPGTDYTFEMSGAEHPFRIIFN